MIRKANFVSAQEFLMNLRCGHQTDRSFAKDHNGLCRKCHSNFSLLLDIEEKFGDVVVEYWYGTILTRLSDDNQTTQCFIEHLTDFYSKKLLEVFSSKQSYIQKNALYVKLIEKTI